jgi:hypothetical protein
MSTTGAPQDPTKLASPGVNAENGHAASDEAAKKKKKKKYSKQLRKLQELERGMVKADRRFAKAILEGIDTWEKRRDKSASKKKDGAIVDSLQNAVHAASKAARVASKSGVDFVDSLRPQIKTKKWAKLMNPMKMLSR